MNILRNLLIAGLLVLLVASCGEKPTQSYEPLEIIEVVVGADTISILIVRPQMDMQSDSLSCLERFGRQISRDTFPDGL